MDGLASAKTSFALLPVHDDLHNPPNKKAGVAAGFCLVTSRRAYLRMI
jgi:hypothetical protein